MLMNRSDENIFKEVECAKSLNLEIIEWLPYRKAEALIAGAFALVNTSCFEGFPNTFLQAGKFGVPILSFEVDPGAESGKEI